MTPASHISTYPWLFAGLSGLPTCLVAVVIAYLIIFGTAAAPSQLPAWVYYASYLCLLVLVAVVGFVVAYCLSLLIAWRYWPLPEPWTRACLIVFTVIWSIVFSCLSLLGFFMGLGDTPQSNLQEFMNNLFKIPLLAFSQAILYSLLVSTGLTVILVALARGIAWCLSVIRIVR